LALHARRRAAIGGAQLDDATGGAAVLMEAGGGSRLAWRGCCDWANAEENKGNGLGRKKGFRAEIIKRIGWLQKCLFELIQGFDFKIKRFEYFQTKFELDSK
jgi:hypothetical protein